MCVKLIGQAKHVHRFSAGLYATIHGVRFFIAGAFAVGLIAMLATWFKRGELGEWTGSTWGFAKQILPLLFFGVLIAGFLLGSPGREGIIPSQWVVSAVGKVPNSDTIAETLQ